jgi:hypothetical protein
MNFRRASWVAAFVVFSGLSSGCDHALLVATGGGVPEAGTEAGHHDASMGGTPDGGAQRADAADAGDDADAVDAADAADAADAPSGGSTALWPPCLAWSWPTSTQTGISTWPWPTSTATTSS